MPRRESTKDCIEFLQAAVCDRLESRKRWLSWLPNFTRAESSQILAVFYRKMKLPVWRHKDVPYFTQPTNNRRAYEEMLRYKLLIVWCRALTGDVPEEAVARLRSEIRELQHYLHCAWPETEPKPDLTSWCVRTLIALEWLGRNTRKLRRCGISACQEFPYFIATPSHKKYCSRRCQEIAEVERVCERQKRLAEEKTQSALNGGMAKLRRLSAEGRERISKAAKAKWDKYRTKKRRNVRNK